MAKKLIEEDLYECEKCGFISSNPDDFIFFEDGIYECKDCYWKNIDKWKKYGVNNE